MKNVLLLVALLCVGCTKKQYQVCVEITNGDSACMQHALSKVDAVEVGRAISYLGRHVAIVQVPTKKMKALPPVKPEEAPPVPQSSSTTL